MSWKPTAPTSASSVAWRGEATASASDELRRLRQVAHEVVDLRARGDAPPRTPRSGRTWPVSYFIRRSAWHVLDHAWEIEDRAEP